MYKNKKFAVTVSNGRYELKTESKEDVAVIFKGNRVFVSKDDALSISF